MNKLEKLEKEFRDKMKRLKQIRDIELGKLTRADRTERDRLLGEVDVLIKDIKAEQRSAGIDEQNDPSFDDDGYNFDTANLDPKIYSVGDNSRQESKSNEQAGGPAFKRDYRSMFCGDDGRTLDRGNFKNTSEFIEVIGSGLFDPRLKRASMVEGIGSEGGFSVPEEFSAQWLDDSLPAEIVRPLCQVWPMKSSDRKIPGWDSADMSSGELFGGFKMEFLAEEGTATKQTGKVRLIKLNAKKGAIFVDISSELEQDGLGFEDQLRNALMKSIGYGIDKYCLNGTGAGQPQGVFNSACLISVAKETGQAADTICYSNLTKMFSRQLNKDNAVWLFNSDAVPELMALTVTIGTGGSHIRVMNEKDGKFTIFGRPVFFTPHMPTVGDAHDCGFVDFGAYALGMRKEMSIDKSIAPGWTQDLVSYRIIIRFDGMGVLSEPVTPENGATLSPFVTLDERA